ncbi:hypothetical protein [Polaromonas eurypsychrophila]|uniref:Uncharacterized protein n=1 Tax=Polaromonas eurypsychrophila TaxID=1614635 RepID=A0A916WB45_9BURK|nr:hypothetical protein [Polaromonas eurypsychrophila]GGA84472.1 hypothetical protein GCM10011496_01230 [Polaromonas eurypsychrophila]
MIEIVLLLIMLAGYGAYTLKSKTQKRRIALLGTHLGQYQVEKLMETLTQGYLRALGEKDAERQVQVWSFLATSEQELCDQFDRFVADFAKVGNEDARVSTFAVFIPEAHRFFPDSTFDMRKLLAVHGQGLRRVATEDLQLSPKARAFMLSAELFLMQHSCHWYCRSKTVASGRVRVRHQTSYAQLLASVSVETRQAYAALVGP